MAKITNFNHTDYIAYFRQLAESHKDILSSADNVRFFRMDMDEILSGKMQNEGYSLILLDVRGAFSGSYDSEYASWQGGFMVVGHQPFDDFDKREEIYDKALKIGTDIFSKMRENYLYWKNFRNSDHRSVSFEQIGPVLDGCYGYQFNFNFTTNLNLNVNESQWQ